MTPLYIENLENFVKKFSISINFKAKNIVQNGDVEIDTVDSDKVTFRVSSQSADSTYFVFLSGFETNKIQHDCTCPDTWNPICKHRAASAYVLLSSYGKNLIAENPQKSRSGFSLLEKKPRLIQLNYLKNKIDEYYIKMYSRTECKEAEASSRNAIEIISAADERVEAHYKNKSGLLNLVFLRDAEGNFHFQCDCCKHLTYKLCSHGLSLYINLFNSYGANYFNTIKDWTSQKKELIKKYGLDPTEESQNRFNFFTKEGKLTAIPKDSSLKTIEALKAFENNSEKPSIDYSNLEELRNLISMKSNNYVAIFSNEHSELFANISLYNAELKDGELDKIKSKVKLDSNAAEETYFENYFLSDLLDLQPSSALLHLVKLKERSLNHYFFSIDQNRFPDNCSNREIQLITKYYIEQFACFAENIKEENLLLYCLPGGVKLSKKALIPVRLTREKIQIHIKAFIEDQFIVLEGFLKTNEKLIPLKETQKMGNPLIRHQEQIYIFPSALHSSFYSEAFPEGKLKFSISELSFVRSKFMIPLSDKFSWEVSEDLIPKPVEPETFEKVVVLSELAPDYLLIRPHFTYDGQEVGIDQNNHIETLRDDELVLLKRNKEEENRLFGIIQKTHDVFKTQRTNPFYYIKFADAVKKNWVFDFIKQMQQEDVSIVGQDKLKNFKYNINKPVITISGNNGIDWFEVNVDVVFGDEKVSLKEIKNAIINKRQYIQLSDGSLGIIPEEWNEKLGLLMKMGQEKNGKLNVSKYNFTVLDELYEEIDSSAIKEELDKRKSQLLNIENTLNLPLPKQLKAELRPYQTGGYQWLNKLHQIGWGGCLADDMGLGKTLQALAFILKRIEEDSESIHLIVCPTSLIFNWESEIKKFAPTANYRIHYGATRSEEFSSKQNIIITSYGMLRNDIAFFTKYQFLYAVLDESHFIKNPSSKIFKAVQLLNTQNRLVLSGTPLQNNTMDLYAQMHFLNPGMLGSSEFFRTEFANPIDKNGDKNQIEKLKKIVYPFMLRRTKEEVAKDLPEKTESILFCEMDQEQRKIYDAFRNAYRNRIMNKIEEEGVAKSSFTILEGLMKLRQICDSPAILNDEVKYPNHSVKLEELMREIEENVGNHKALIFSQFLGMLDLVSQELKNRNIQFEYLDGSTPAQERKNIVERFQSDDQSRVFLISLKAGGVGLNLTAADYVYLVDPWWNPAVEAQAIDRTHRIGQNKSVFAYRMICKDTIEEKIMLLQEKKKTLSSELIHEESGFVKKLTKNDVEYLFS